MYQYFLHDEESIQISKNRKQIQRIHFNPNNFHTQLLSMKSRSFINHLVHVNPLISLVIIAYNYSVYSVFKAIFNYG